MLPENSRLTPSSRTYATRSRSKGRKKPRSSLIRGASRAAHPAATTPPRSSTSGSGSHGWSLKASPKQTSSVYRSSTVPRMRRIGSSSHDGRRAKRMIAVGKILRILAAEGVGGVTARIRRRWRLGTFVPHVLEKQHAGVRFRFYIGTTEGQEWYGRFVDTRLYKPLRAELAWLGRAAEPGDVVADVGAHHGYFSVLMAHWVGARGKVYAL